MIISITDAFNIDENIEQEDLDAFEIMVREVTNNNFQNDRIRYKDITFISDSSIGVKGKLVGLKKDDTIQINYSGYNDGLYTIESVTDDVITVRPNSFTEIDLKGAMITKVEYPADIKRGIKNIIKYDKKMQSKIGIKSESIARMSLTYYDNNDSASGYPSSMLSFLTKYEKMRW